MKKFEDLVRHATEKMQGGRRGDKQGSSSINDVSRYPKDLAKGTFASKSFDELTFSPDVERRKYDRYQKEYFSPEDLGSGQHISLQEHLLQQQREHDDIPQSYDSREDRGLRALHEDIQMRYNKERKLLNAERQNLLWAEKRHPHKNFDREYGELDYKNERMLEARSREMRALRNQGNRAATIAESYATMPSRREHMDID